VHTSPAVFDFRSFGFCPLGIVGRVKFLTSPSRYKKFATAPCRYLFVIVYQPVPRTGARRQAALFSKVGARSTPSLFTVGVTSLFFFATLDMNFPPRSAVFHSFGNKPIPRRNDFLRQHAPSFPPAQFFGFHADYCSPFAPVTSDFLPFRSDLFSPGPTIGVVLKIASLFFLGLFFFRSHFRNLSTFFWLKVRFSCLVCTYSHSSVNVPLFLLPFLAPIYCGAQRVAPRCFVELPYLTLGVFWGVVWFFLLPTFPPISACFSSSGTSTL